MQSIDVDYGKLRRYDTTRPPLRQSLLFTGLLRALCGISMMGQKYEIEKMTTVKDGDITNLLLEDLEEGTYYKYYVKAYKLVNGQKVFLGRSKTIHVTTDGSRMPFPNSYSHIVKSVTASSFPIAL